MLPDPRPTSRPLAVRRRALACLLLGGAAACSALPPAAYPPFAEHLIAADFVVPPQGRLSLPTTTPELVLLDLGAVPPPEAEVWGPDGERWLVYEPGTEVQVRCRYRSYAPPGGAPQTPREVLPGAVRVEVLSSP